jgi:hypothetical protein
MKSKTHRGFFLHLQNQNSNEWNLKQLRKL